MHSMCIYIYIYTHMVCITPLSTSKGAEKRLAVLPGESRTPGNREGEQQTNKYISIHK